MSISFSHFFLFFRNNISYFVIILFLILSFLIPIRFEENDDIIMLLITSGKFSFSDPGFILLSNTFYGRFINFLYETIDGVEWYSVFLFLTNFLGYILILKNILVDRLHFDSFKMSTLLVLISFYVHSLLHFQFTLVAAALATGALLNLLNSFKFYQIFGSLVCLFIASMIRFEVFCIIFFVFTPFIFLKYKLFWLKYMPLSVCVVISFGIYFLDHEVVNRSHYVDSNLTEIRGIVDNPNNQKTNLKLPQGVTKEKYQLFCSFVTDESVLTTNQRQQVFSSLNDQISWKDKWNSLISVLMPHKWLLFVLIIWITVFFFRARYLDRIAIVISVLFSIVLMLLIAEMGLTLKRRVIYSILLALAFVLTQVEFRKTIKNSFLILAISFLISSSLVFYSLFGNIFIWFTVCSLSLYYWYRTQNKNYKFKFVFLVISGFLFLFGFYKVTDRIIFLQKAKQLETQAVNENQIKLLKRYEKEVNKPVFIVPGNESFISLSPFHISKALKGINMVFSGWVTFIDRKNVNLMSTFGDLHKKSFGIFLIKNNRRPIDLYYTKRNVLKVSESSKTNEIIQIAR